MSLPHAVDAPRICKVTTAEDLDAFLDLPGRLHRDDPAWVPPLREWAKRRIRLRKSLLRADPDLALFTARFDPQLDDAARDAAEDAALTEVQELIDAVTGLDADRILRGCLGMVRATLRTNYYRDRPFLSFKLDPSAVPEMPARMLWKTSASSLP